MRKGIVTATEATAMLTGVQVIHLYHFFFLNDFVITAFSRP